MRREETHRSLPIMNILVFVLCTFYVLHLGNGGNVGNEIELETRSRFEQFMTTFDKVYPSEERAEERFRIFRANLKKIDALNKYEQGDAVYGVTRFADLTKSEFEKYHLGLKYDAERFNNSLLESKPNLIGVQRSNLPSEFDWRSHNVVTGVKNQGMCGSCWAFSITGNVEGQYAIKHGELRSFSEQELVDCDKKDHGCEGGYMTDGYSFIETLGGLENETDYPYEGVDDSCKFVKSKVAAVVLSYVNISSDENVMAEWLFKNGPISIAINANAMQFYFGGVSHPFKFLCNPNNLNHGVLLVGYGLHKTKFTKKILPYWLIKNSWGSSWGEQGYYRLFRGSGVCGVNKMPTSAIVQ